jgi:hypothetical protein
MIIQCYLCPIIQIGVYVSDMITEFERSSRSQWQSVNVTSRQLLLRSLSSDAKATISDATSIAPINLFGWNDWSSKVSYAQVWGRAPTGSTASPIDATILAANGAIITR